MITVKTRKIGDLMTPKSLTEGTAEVRKRTIWQTVGKNQVRDEEGKRGAEVRTLRGNDEKEAEVKVPVTAGVGVTAEARRGKMRLTCEIERRKERDMTMRDQVDRGQMKEERNIHDLHVLATMKVKKYIYQLFQMQIFSESLS